MCEKEVKVGAVKNSNGVSVAITFKMSTERFQKLTILAAKVDLPVVAYVSHAIGTLVEKRFKAL